MQDQAGELLTFGDFFVGLPSIVVFFYTRCDMEVCGYYRRAGRLQRLLKKRP